MDDFKKANNDKMTAFDLNCKYVESSIEVSKIKKNLRRMARRRMKQQLREENYE